jgi:hypothetical protein
MASLAVPRAWEPNPSAVFRDLVAGCSAAALQSGGGRVERFAQIAVRHPDDHRAELEAALGI